MLFLSAVSWNLAVIFMTSHKDCTDLVLSGRLEELEQEAIPRKEKARLRQEEPDY